VYWNLLDVGVQSKIINSSIDHNKRDQILTDFKLNRFNVLCATKVLDEGYNLKNIEIGIIMAGDSSDKQTVAKAWKDIT